MARSQEASTPFVLNYQDVEVYQENDLILSEVNLELEKGGFAYLIGRTGGGKTSLLKTVYGDLPIFGKKAQIAGHNLLKLTRAETPLLRRKLGIIFQDFQLLFDRSVDDNLEFVLRAIGWTDSVKIKGRLQECLFEVGLHNALGKYPHQLSGGEQQRLAIARAILNEPALLIADEPTGNLDPAVAREIMKIFLNINKKGTAILMATHNYFLLEEFPQETWYCDGGKVKKWEAGMKKGYLKL